MPRKMQLDIQPFGKAQGIDAEKRVLRGAQVMQMGEAKGHGVEIDQKTLEAIVKLGNGMGAGVKSRFGHPSLCSPGLGTYLGRRTNFRIDGDLVRSDFSLSEAADPAMADHVLKMAEHDPDMIGNSVVIEAEREFRVDEKGEKLRDKDGNVLMPLLRPKKLFAVDVVDEPAAGGGMFADPIEGANFSPTTFIEIDRAMKLPGFRERFASFLDWSSKFETEEEETNDALAEGEEQTPENPAMTLAELKAKHPEAFAEHSKEIETALAPKVDAAVNAERARCVTVLSKCDSEHFAKTKEHPEGFVQHAIEKGLSLQDAFSGLMDLSKRKNTLELLSKDTAETTVDPVAPPAAGKEFSTRDQARKSLQLAREARQGAKA